MPLFRLFTASPVINLSFFLSLFLSVAVHATVIIPKPPVLDASAYILIDADSGHVLVEHNSSEQLPPASMTKMMTSYICLLYTSPSPRDS